MRFDTAFWVDRFRDLGYPLRHLGLDVGYLRGQGILPRELEVSSAKLLYRDDYVEVVVLELERLAPRGLCSRVARGWKGRRLRRPLLVFTDGVDSYAVIVPGPGVGGEVKALRLHGELYRTDREVLESLRFPGDPEKLREAYDAVFFPYEKVRDEFFQGYRALFERIIDSVKKLLGQDAQSYAQRFLGRLMFLYFLQRKGWLKGDRKFIDKIGDFRELNRLFYESLNKEDGEEGLPFLNGSLFEREPYMTDKMEAGLFPVMDPIFKEAREFFNRYNFTVDETSPMEVEVSIDPLLLGTVLENMLPEHERGERGTFYTPVDEIGFMCRRAISVYLGLGDRVEAKSDRGTEFVDGLSEFVERLKREKSEEKVREFKEKLLSLRVLDPAVGSGGFLVVMMQTLVQLIHEAEGAVGWKTDPEELKRRILPNLFGFDIEPEAVEIARLRLWLSLIIDQKYPLPLPNLDMNIMEIHDALSRKWGYTTKLDELEHQASLRDKLEWLREKYLTEHDPRKRQHLRKEINELQEVLMGKIDPKGIQIEFYLPERAADIVVMNPPYVRQEKVPLKKKQQYINDYRLDRTSDLYAYFMVRSLELLKENGVAAIISSDKWLETNYGRTLQKRLKPHLVAVYGQRHRSFTADVNTVITVLTKKRRDAKEPVQFVYLESYTEGVVRNYKAIKRGELTPGKWYYLRAPKIFEEVLLPKLTHRLEEFAEIKRGFTTGANEFFYLKDVSHLYEADRLANPKKFREWGVTAKNEGALRRQGLIYVENEGGERFLLERDAVRPILRSPRQIRSYGVEEPETLCFWVRGRPGPFASRYIEWGRRKGFYKRPTCRARDPWYSLHEFQEAKIFPPMSWGDVMYISYSPEPYVCDARLYGLYPKKPGLENTLACYLNSTLFFLTVELYCRRLGGGATDIKVEDYEQMPVPDLAKTRIDFDFSKFAREPLKYMKEVEQADRKELDRAVLRAMGFKEKELEGLVDELHRAFVEVVEDRLIKAGRPLKQGEEAAEE